MPDTSRVLLAILVYNGQDFVPRCVESARRVMDETPGVETLVLDDCSPEPGWSEKLKELTDSVDIGYYRSPRNLGIPRNMNLGLLRGISEGYDHVVILNSDVILPANLVESLLKVVGSEEQVGSVTAWSNSCSVYSLSNSAPDRFLQDPAVVDWLSAAMAQKTDAAGVDVPAAVGFCMLIPTRAISEVGLFDPVFGRGYCEELDWCLRAKALGFRNLLAHNVFVYHQGSGSTREAGLLAAGETTVSAHEQIIDWRYPLFRQQVEAFLFSDVCSQMQADGLRHILCCAGREFGYDVDLRITTLEPRVSNRVQVVIPSDYQRGMVRARYIGFEADFRIDLKQPILEGLHSIFGRPPERMFLYGRGPLTHRLAAEGQQHRVPLLDRLGYPESLGPDW